MNIKVSVIIVIEDKCGLGNKCIESFKKQQLRYVEILYVEDGRYRTALSKASGEFIMFTRENETADQELLDIAVRCGEESGAEIVLLPDKKFNIEKGYISGVEVHEACIEKKLFRREYINNNFKYILNDDIRYSRYIGLSLLAGTENIFTMYVSRLYSRDDKKIDGEEILQNYKLLYDDLCARNKWDEKKQKFSNWLLADISSWLGGVCFTSDIKISFKKIKSQLLTKVDLLEHEDKYYISEKSRSGVNWVNGIVAGERFAIKHNIDYEKKKITLVKKSELSNEPLISIIMPVYNVEKYIDEALISLESQTFLDFEIICVDDGSTDCSLEILSQYADKDSRISIYYQLNCGQSVARNRAIKYVRGKYIYFMDSDDILHKTALEMLYSRCEQYDLDVIYFDGGIVSDLPEEDSERKRFETYYKRVGKYNKNVYKGSELMREMCLNNEYRVSPCLQLIRKEYIINHGIRFHQGIIHEDNAFNFFCMIQAERVGYLGIELFSRRVRSDSTMTKRSTFENVYGYLSCYVDIMNWLQNIDLPDSDYQTVYEVLDSLLHSAKYKYSIMKPYERVVLNYLKPYERVLCQKLITEEVEKKG